MTPQRKMPRNVLAKLRAFVPNRVLDDAELEHIVEQQVVGLLHLFDVVGPPVPIHDIAVGVGRVTVECVEKLETSGSVVWNGQNWVLRVNTSEPWARQRATLAHELAHVIYHPLAVTILHDGEGMTAAERLERLCDHFSAALLMPRVWLKRAYFIEGIQDLTSLCPLFGASSQSLLRRYYELGLTSDPDLERQEVEAA